MSERDYASLREEKSSCLRSIFNLRFTRKINPDRNNSRMERELKKKVARLQTAMRAMQRREGI